MAKRLIINVGFITNSSSAIHWFPKEILEDPDVKAFMDAYGLSGGHVGDNLWHRGYCDTVAITAEQKQAVHTQLSDSEYGGHIGGSVNPGDDNTFVVIYGDEYLSVTSELADILSRVCAERGLSHNNSEFN